MPIGKFADINRFFFGLYGQYVYRQALQYCFVSNHALKTSVGRTISDRLQEFIVALTQASEHEHCKASETDSHDHSTHCSSIASRGKNCSLQTVFTVTDEKPYLSHDIPKS